VRYLPGCWPEYRAPSGASTACPKTDFNFWRPSGEGDEIVKDAVVSFEIGADPKTGKSKAVSVDLV
jgi:hypothetical protein